MSTERIANIKLLSLIVLQKWPLQELCGHKGVPYIPHKVNHILFLEMNCVLVLFFCAATLAFPQSKGELKFIYNPTGWSEARYKVFEPKTFLFREPSRKRNVFGENTLRAPFNQ